jgi:hypothetical protein
MVTTIALLGAAAPIFGAFETTVDVLQPIMVDEFISLSPVTCVKVIGDRNPGYSVSLGCAESRVIDERGRSVSRNAASLLGANTGFDPFHGNGELFGDTLRVFLDLSSLTNLNELPPGLRDYSPAVVVSATVECVLTAAWADRWGWDFSRNVKVEANYVALEIRGSSA